METTISRTRGTRNTYYPRKKRTSINDDGRITKIIKQLIISGAIFIIVLTIKNIDSPLTNYLSDKTSSVLRNDAELNSVYTSIKNAVTSLNVTNEKLRSAFSVQKPQPNTESPQQQESEPEASNTVPDSMKDKIYDWTLLKDKGFAVPVSGVLTSGFGSRISPITKENEFHEGIDIDAKTGENVKAVLDGTVVEAKKSASLGNYVKVKHDGDIYSLYAHASSISVKEGQKVKKGAVIAKAGNTGQSAGPHLHLEIWKGDKMVNPQSLLGYSQVVDNK